MVHRSPKGFGASHPFIEKSSTNLGKNPFKVDPEEENKDEKKKKVGISKKLKARRMKISEDKIREIIRQEINQRIEEGFSWYGKEYKMPWEDDVSWDPRDSIFADAAGYGVDNAVAAAELSYKASAAAAEAAAEDISYVADTVSDSVKTAYKYWTEKGFSGGIEEFYEEIAYISSRAKEGYEKWLDDARAAASKRTPSSPQHSIYMVYEDWARDIVPDIPYDTVLYSEQLKVESIFHAVTLFYSDFLGQKSTAEWGPNGTTYPGFEGVLKWGAQTRAGFLGLSLPHYEWLASKFKIFGVTEDSEILSILGSYPPAKIGEKMKARDQEMQALDPDAEIEDLFEDARSVTNYRTDFSSPLYGLRQDAASELRKIKSAMQGMTTDGEGNAIWRVFYGNRGFGFGPDSWFESYRDTFEIASRLGVDEQGNPGILGTVMDIVSEIPPLPGPLAEAAQLCIFSHWTDDPRWIQSPVKPFMMPYGEGTDFRTEGFEVNVIEPCMTFGLP